MRFYSNKEKKIFSQENNFELKKKDEMKQKNEIIFLNGEKFFIEDKKFFFPHLNSFEKKILNENNFKEIFIDNGAVSFMVKGANLAKPGIETFNDEIKKNDIVLIKNKNFPKILCVGISLFSAEDLKKTKKGIVVKILHYLKDKYY